MKNMNKGMKIAIVSVASVLVIAIAVLGIMIANNKIYNGVSVAGVDLGGMTISEAVSMLDSEDFFKESIDFVCEDRKFEINKEAIALKCDAAKTAEMAHAYGRDANIFVRLGNIFDTMFNPADLPIEVMYDEDKLDIAFDEYIGDLCEPTAAPQMRIDGDRLYIKNGSQGLGINKEKLGDDMALLANGKLDTIELVIETVNPTAVSAKDLHDEYATEVINADYTISNYRISYTESVDGIDFDIEEAQKIIDDNAKSSREYYIPLTVIKPEKTVEQLDKSMFGDCLGTYTTKYNPGEVGRTKNVTLAANHINNVVLKNGDVFSYNNIVGERTAARGFAGAKVYSGGNVVDGLGGGICQVSSTLYNTVLLADLEIVSRTNHSLPVTYVPLGRDATVSYGSIDFKFKNQYEHPVKISSTIGGGTLTIAIYGTKTSDKKVELYTETLSTLAFEVVEQPDESIEVGATKVKQSGSNGAVVNTYKKVTENGKVVSDKLIHKSVYNPINKIVLIPPTAVTPEGTSPDGVPAVPEGITDPSYVQTPAYGIPTEQIPTEQPTADIPVDSEFGTYVPGSASEVPPVETSGDEVPTVGVLHE